MNLDLLLPDSDLGPELREHARQMREFAADKLAPHARSIDEQRRFRREMVHELAAGGVLGGPLDRSWGGGGWSPMELAIAHEEIGAVCGSTRGFLAVHTGLVAQCIESYGNAEQKQRWLPSLVRGEAIGCFCLTEPEAGSDVASLRTRADRSADGYVLHGQKIWITNGGIADLAVVFATVDPDKGRDGITAFVVETDRPGLRRVPVEGIELGHRGSDHAQLFFEGLEVPDAAVIGDVGKGLRVAMGALAAGRLSVAAGAVGIHRAAPPHGLARMGDDYPLVDIERPAVIAGEPGHVRRIFDEKRVETACCHFGAHQREPAIVFRL